MSPFLKRAAVTTRGSCVLLLLPQFCCFTLHWRLFYYLVHRRKHLGVFWWFPKGVAFLPSCVFPFPAHHVQLLRQAAQQLTFFSQCPLPALCALGASMRCISPRQPDLSSTPTQSLRCSCCSVSLTVWSVLTESTTATK